MLSSKKLLSIFMAAQMLLITSCSTAVLKPSAAPGSDYYNGYTDGLQAAESRSSEACWGAGGWGGTVVCCLIGGGVALMAGNSNANPPPELLMDRSADYAAGFTDAFKARAKQKRQQAAWLGVGVGLLTNLVVGLAISASQ